MDVRFSAASRARFFKSKRTAAKDLLNSHFKRVIDESKKAIMKATLKPIKPQRITDQVFEQLRELIYRGQLKPQEQLLPERELAEALSVSRTTVRGAINKLVALGLLEQKQGQGTFVRSMEKGGNNPLAVALEAENISLTDLLEVRLGLETNAASLAARRATEADIGILRKTLTEMEDQAALGPPSYETDTAFHMAITYATKNPAQIFLMRHFYDYLTVGIKENLARLYEDPANIQSVLQEHRNIFNAIAKHDPESAFAAMKLHIRNVVIFFRDNPA
jgi:GntR family transcriptional repressor for pyruvate dehydrogenase complex